MAGYLRLKYQHWTIDEAIAAMRAVRPCLEKIRKGRHNELLARESSARAIAKTLNPAAPAYYLPSLGMFVTKQPNTNS